MEPEYGPDNEDAMVLGTPERASPQVKGSEEYGSDARLLDLVCAIFGTDDLPGSNLYENADLALARLRASSSGQSEEPTFTDEDVAMLRFVACDDGNPAQVRAYALFRDDLVSLADRINQRLRAHTEGRTER